MSTIKRESKTVDSTTLINIFGENAKIWLMSFVISFSVAATSNIFMFLSSFWGVELPTQKGAV